MRQLLFCLETNKKSRSDWFYLSEAIRRFYEVDSKTSIKPLFMGAKSKYASKDIRKEIANYTKDSKNPATVFYCIDLDGWDRNPEDYKLNQGIINYCKEEGAELIWFCRDIEDVFLGHQISDDAKTNLAKEFKIKSMIQKVSVRNLSSEEWVQHRSNLLCVLDRYLVRKTI